MADPYQTPTVSQSYENPSGGEISRAVTQALRGTKGWVRFIAVLGFIGCGFLLLATLAILMTGASPGMPGWGGAVGLIYLVMTGVYFYLAFRLNQYASRIGTFLAFPDGVHLAGALESQRSFWKCLGIMAIIFITLYLVIIALVVFAFNSLSGI